MKQKWKRWEKLELITLFLFSISLFNMAGYIFTGLMLAVFVLNFKKIRIGLPEVLLVFFSCYYFCFYVFHNGLQFDAIILFLCGPWVSFLIGKLFVRNASSDKAFITFIVVLSAGMFLHGLLNWITYLRSYYFSNYYDYYRHSVDVWRGTLVNVNTTGMFFTFASGLSLGVLFADNRKKRQFIALAVLALCVGITAFFANRTLILIIGMIFAWRGINWLFSRKVQEYKKVLTILVICCLLIILGILIAMNAGGLRSWISDLKIVDRFLNEKESGRLKVWKIFWEDENYLHHAFGGGNMLAGSPYNYLHNLWLDVYNATGIFPFTTLIFFTVWGFGRIMHFGQLMKKCDKTYIFTIFHSLMAAIFFKYACRANY